MTKKRPFFITKKVVSLHPRPPNRSFGNQKLSDFCFCTLSNKICKQITLTFLINIIFFQNSSIYNVD
eukprot:UN27615